MSEQVDLYSAAYRNYEADAYRQIRIETYGADLGQTSWVSTDESHNIPVLLKLLPIHHVLEIGCGSGRYALQVAETIGCRILGLDINQPGIENANQLATARSMASQARFELCDASKGLRFDSESFDAVFSNDVLCHVPGRLDLLREVFRILKPGGRFLFSDALVIGGTISHSEIAARSLIGYYIFSPVGENERLLQQAGFLLLSATDTTESAAVISRRWHGARGARKAELIAVEGARNFEGGQDFLSCVNNLTRERRLLRFLYLAEKRR